MGPEEGLASDGQAGMRKEKGAHCLARRLFLFLFLFLPCAYLISSNKEDGVLG